PARVKGPFSRQLLAHVAPRAAGHASPPGGRGSRAGPGGGAQDDRSTVSGPKSQVCAKAARHARWWRDHDRPVLVSDASAMSPAEGPGPPVRAAGRETASAPVVI